ncbi:MAG: disulfide bond formation protein B [Rhodospirillaceae bacterium]|nr:disulfide bond formation protein B [Rhodospirillaceae bacterium]
MAVLSQHHGRGVPLLTPVNVSAVLLAGTLIALGGALIFQYAGYPPCALCIYQRIPYVATLAFSLVALSVALHRPTAQGVGKWGFVTLVGLCAIAFAIGAGLAGFHIGVEQGWWKGTEACVGTASQATTLDEMRDAIMNAPIVRCDEAPWHIFGISIAGLNLIASLALFTIAVTAVVSWLKKTAHHHD